MSPFPALRAQGSPDGLRRRCARMLSHAHMRGFLFLPGGLASLWPIA